MELSELVIYRISYQSNLDARQWSKAHNNSGRHGRYRRYVGPLTWTISTSIFTNQYALNLLLKSRCWMPEMIRYYGHAHFFFIVLSVVSIRDGFSQSQPADGSDIIDETTNCSTGTRSMTWSQLESWSSDLRESVVSSKVSSTLSQSTSPTSSTQDEVGCDDKETPSSLPQKKKKVLLIGVDGIRADAAGMLPLPNFRRLERMGSYSYWANVQQLGSAVSGPGWVR